MKANRLVAFTLFLIIVAILILVRINNLYSDDDTGKIESAAQYHTISPEDVKAKLDNNEDFYLIDVRTKQEFDTGFIPSAINIPLDVIASEAKDSFTNKDEVIVIYCRSGNRSQTATNLLVDLGYTQVYDLGGIISWPYEISN